MEDKIEQAKATLNRIKGQTYEAMLFHYENSLKRKSLKDLAKACCALDSILYTKEGQDKKAIIAKYVTSKRVEKFNEYITLYTNFSKWQATFMEMTSKKGDYGLFISVIQQKAKREGLYTYRLNRLLSEGKNSEETIEEIAKYRTGSLNLKYNYKAKRLYLYPTGLWESIEQWQYAYMGNMQRAKAIIMALEEYIEKTPLASEFIPPVIEDCIRLLKLNPPTRTTKDHLKKWLKAVEAVSTEEELEQWEKAQEDKELPLLFPPYEEIEPNKALLETITGKYNMFERN